MEQNLDSETLFKPDLPEAQEKLENNPLFSSIQDLIILSKTFDKNNKPESPKEKTEKKDYSLITSILKELKNYIIAQQNEETKDSKINEYLLFPNLLDINLLKSKIFEAFNYDSFTQILNFILTEINQFFISCVVKKNFPSKNTKENPLSKIQFFDLLKELSFFISKNIIYLDSESDQAKEAFQLFNDYIIYDNQIGKKEMNAFINIFNIRDALIAEFSWNKEKLLNNLISCSRTLALISILNLEKIITFKYYIQSKNKLILEQEIFIYDLYLTYNQSLKEIQDMTEYLLSFKKNFISPITIEKIIFDKSIKEKLSTTLTSLIINNLMKYPEGYKIHKKDCQANPNQVISYFHVITLNKTLIEKVDLNKQIHYINKFFSFLIENKEFDKAIKLINSLEKSFIYGLDKESLHHYVNMNISNFERIEQIINILQYYKNEVNFILNELKSSNRMKEGIKLIKFVGLTVKEYEKSWDNYSIKSFYEYKVNDCRDKLELLLDYGYINERNYNELMKKMLKRLEESDENNYLLKNSTYKFNRNILFKYENVYGQIHEKGDDWNNDYRKFLNDYSLKDAGRIINNKNFNKLSNKKEFHKSYKKNLEYSIDKSTTNSNNYSFISSSDENTDINIINSNININLNINSKVKSNKFEDYAKEDIQILSEGKSTEKTLESTPPLKANIFEKQYPPYEIQKEKIVILFRGGLERRYKLSFRIKKKFDERIGLKLPHVDFSKYIQQDDLAPHDPLCLKLSEKKNSIVFIDSINSFVENYKKYFIQSKIIGVDSEWTQHSFANSRDEAAILQMANYDERNIMIIDMISLNNNKEFQKLFYEFFWNKTFVGHSFNSSDMKHFSEGIRKTFEIANIYDLVDLYQYKFLKKGKSLKSMCQELLGKDLCKYEQCSNWELRPLRKKQMHYAALDAIVCIQLYKKIANENKDD